MLATLKFKFTALTQTGSVLCLAENFKGLLYGLQDSIVLHVLIYFQIRSDTSLCVDKTVPGIQEKCESMQQIFERIDKLEVSDRVYFQLSKIEHKIVIIFLPTNLNICFVCSKEPSQ